MPSPGLGKLRLSPDGDDIYPEGPFNLKKTEGVFSPFFPFPRFFSEAGLSGSLGSSVLCSQTSRWLVGLVTWTIFSGAHPSLAATVFLQEIAGLMNWDYIGIMVLVRWWWWWWNLSNDWWIQVFQRRSCKVKLGWGAGSLKGCQHMFLWFPYFWCFVLWYSGMLPLGAPRHHQHDMIFSTVSLGIPNC